MLLETIEVLKVATTIILVPTGASKLNLIANTFCNFVTYGFSCTDISALILTATILQYKFLRSSWFVTRSVDRH